MPGISILMAAFNAGTLIRPAIESALAEMNEADELIVQDGGSTDGSLAIVRSFADSDPRIKYVSERDTGQSEALNRALARATQPYVLWLNADDVLLPGALDAMRSASGCQGLDLVAAGHQTLRADGSVLGTYRPGRLDRRLLLQGRTWVFSGSLLMNAGLLRRLGGFDEESHYCMDLDLLLRLSSLPGLEVAYIDQPVGTLRWHDASKSGGAHWRFLRDAWHVRLHHSHTRLERLWATTATARLAMEIGTIGMRHTRLYRRLRSIIRRSSTTLPGARNAASTSDV